MDHYLEDIGLGEEELKRRKRLARAASLPEEDRGLVYWEVRNALHFFSRIFRVSSPTLYTVLNRSFAKNKEGTPFRLGKVWIGTPMALWYRWKKKCLSCGAWIRPFLLSVEQETFSNQS